MPTDKRWKVIVKAAQSDGLSRADKRAVYEDIYSGHSDAMFDILVSFVGEYGFHGFGGFWDGLDWLDAVQNAYCGFIWKDGTLSGTLCDALVDYAEDQGMPSEFVGYVDWQSYLHDATCDGVFWQADNRVFNVMEFD